MHRYDDIIGLPHPEPRSHRRMSLESRAAQFAPFAALTGYEDAIIEAGRLTEDRVELDENRKHILDERLRYLAEHSDVSKDDHRIRFTYFVEDLRKDGGEYRTVEGGLKRIDAVSKSIIMEDGITIPIDDIIDIEVEDFYDYR